MVKRSLWWLTVPLLLLAAWLGIRDLNTNPFWGDERYSIEDIGGVFGPPRTVGDIWQEIATHDPRHVPGYLIALSGWARLVGYEPAALRVFSLLIGLLGVAWTYRLARDVVSPEAGIFAAALVASEMLVTHYLIKVRMYIPLVPLTAFTLWIYLRVIRLRRFPNVLEWIGLLLGAAALMYTHYMAAVPLVAIGLYHLLFAPKTRRWWLVVGVLALSGVLFLPWLAALLAGIATEAQEIHNPLSAGETLSRLAYLFGNGSIALALIGLALAIIATLRTPRWSRQWRIAWLFAVVSVALVVAANQAFAILRWERVRYLIGVMPVLALLVSMGLAWLWRQQKIGRVIAFGMVALWVGLGIYQTLDRRMSWEIDLFGFIFPTHLLEGELDTLAQSNDLIVLYLPDGLERTEHEASRHVAKLETDEGDGEYWVTTTEFFPNQAAEEHRVRLETVASRPRVWLSYVADRPSATLDDFTSELGEMYAQCPSPLAQENPRVVEFVTNPVCCLTDVLPAARAQFDNGVQLIRLDAPQNAELQLEVMVLWSLPPDLPPHEYSASLQLVDAQGSTVRHADYGLEPLAYACQAGHLDLDGLPAGDYTLSVVLYRWQTGERVIGTTSDGQRGELLALGTVTVGSPSTE